jgi:Fe-S-cluster-containing hydrogenase component 2
MAAQVTFIGLQQEFRAEVMPNLDVLAIDETLCIRCDNCVKACAAAHEDGISRLIRKGAVFEEILLPTACRFCQDPVCLLCRSGGIKRDKDGDIYFTESCIGCGSCAERCPYGNIIMVDTEELNQPARPTLWRSLLEKVHKSSKKPVIRELEHRPYLKEIPVKCDLDRGHLFPACVNNCPTQAIKRYRADELDRIIAKHGKR